MNLPEVNLNTQLISIFYYTKTRISNIHNEYRVLQFSVWYIYLRFLLEHVQIERTTKKKKNQIPTLEKKQSTIIRDTATLRQDATDREGIIMISVLFNFTLP